MRLPSPRNLRLMGKVIQSTRISEDLRVHLILKESGIVSSGCGAATSVLE